MQSVVIVGMTGRRCQKLCRFVCYRTAGGACVCSREIEYAGIDFGYSGCRMGRTVAK